jgi:YD repeat-containing protein
MISIRRIFDSRIRWLLTAGLVAAVCAGATDAQTAKTTKYKYDALGRLTFVEDSVNGNRDYDYDAAGNRRNVAVGGVDDAASEPTALPPPPVPGDPTGLASHYVADCSWSSSWNAVSTATSYKFSDSNGQIETLTVTNKTVFCPTGQPAANKPYWVRACNANGCSAFSYF